MSPHKNTRFILEEMRSELLERRKRMEDQQRTKLDPDFEEQVTQRADNEIIDTLDMVSLDRLKRINRALARVDANEYGQCEHCGENIDSNRLEAIPYAELCYECASREEATH